MPNGDGKVVGGGPVDTNSGAKHETKAKPSGGATQHPRPQGTVTGGVR